MRKISEENQRKGEKTLHVIHELKKANSIPDHPDKKDYMRNGGRCFIYTTNRDDAELMGELIFKLEFGNRRKTVLLQQTKRNIKVNQIGQDSFEITFPLHYIGYEDFSTKAKHFTELLQSQTKGPDVSR